MNTIVTCEYCSQDYWSYLVYRMPEGSVMCQDCVRADVPLKGDKVVA